MHVLKIANKYFERGQNFEKKQNNIASTFTNNCTAC